jgi:hypothetical protein
VSKELSRIYYRGSQWHKEVNAAKQENLLTWRSRVQSNPEPLPPAFLNLISAVYGNYTNEITKRKWFDVPPLAEVLDEIRSYIDV